MNEWVTEEWRTILNGLPKNLLWQNTSFSPRMKPICVVNPIEWFLRIHMNTMFKLCKILPMYWTYWVTLGCWSLPLEPDGPGFLLQLQIFLNGGHFTLVSNLYISHMDHKNCAHTFQWSLAYIDDICAIVDIIGLPAYKIYQFWYPQPNFISVFWWRLVWMWNIWDYKICFVKTSALIFLRNFKMSSVTTCWCRGLGIRFYRD